MLGFQLEVKLSPCPELDFLTSFRVDCLVGVALIPENPGKNKDKIKFMHYSAQASFLLLFVESGTRKMRKVVESRTKFLFDVQRFLDSTTVLVLDSTPIMLL